MTKKFHTQPENGTAILIPLCRLKKSPNNARKTPHTKAEIEALAASIAAHGMLQNPVVEPERKRRKPTGYYLVTIGEGRRLAQLLRVKRKEIAKNEAIRCVIDNASNPIEISLAENEIRAPMHPADQFDAFHTLHKEEGQSAEDIAARFGVTPAVVRQRLKLAAVSPKLIQSYRAGDMTLEQLTAFAITDNHRQQEAVWKELPEWDRSRDAIVRALTGSHVPADDRRARFVGLDAYQAAGGGIVRDLFDDEIGGYLTDPALLDRLAQEKLEGFTATLKDEGWKWIATFAAPDHSFTSELRRIYPQRRTLDEDEQAQLEALEAEYEALEDDGSDEVAREAERIDQAIATLTGEAAYAPEEIARAGVILSLNADGTLRIERGYVRAEDDVRETTPKPKRTAPDGKPPLSDKLISELTAHRTMALRDALGVNPEAALIAVVHALAATTFYPHSSAVSCLQITGRSAYLGSHAPGIDETPAARRLSARHDALAAAMPEDASALWDHLAAMDETQRLALLAHCVALTVDAVQTPHARDAVGRQAHASQLAQAVALDMTAQWKPTAASYFKRVSKDRILEAVREAVSTAAADNIKALAKGAMADAAEARMAESGWLPPPLRTEAREAIFG